MEIESRFDFSTLPSIVLLRILKLIRGSFDDVRNLSLVNKCLRKRILQDLSLLYNPLVVLDNGRNNQGDLNLQKPVLALKLVCTDTLTQDEFESNDSHINSLRSRVGSHSQAIWNLGKLDLSTIRSLQLINRAMPGKGEAYKGMLKVLPLNPSLNCSQLEHLSMDVYLINLSEIREAIINVVYQHDDFNNGANIDYIINSAISQVLYTLLTFLDGLYSEYRNNYVHKRIRLKTLEINFQTREKTDWTEVDPASFSITEAEHLRNCLMFMINEFKERINLNYGITDEIRVTGLPQVFQKDILELTTAAINEACDLWPCDPHKKPFEIVVKENLQGFDLHVSFPRPANN